MSAQQTPARRRQQVTRRLRQYYGVDVTRQQAGDGGWLEARLLREQSREAGQAYADIAEELSDDRTTLADLDPEAVAMAEGWAKRNHQRWPPRPTTSGWQVIVLSA